MTKTLSKHSHVMGVSVGESKVNSAERPYIPDYRDEIHFYLQIIFTDVVSLSVRTCFD